MKLWLALLAFFFIASAAAEERIHEYLVDISIQKDGSMLVTETIDVNIEGVNIKRGIYRDFPVHYKDSKGFKYKVDFEVISTQLDGVAVANRLSDNRNYKRLYLGSKSTLAPSGRHIYTISYRTNYQLGFFAEHDELYWNAIGPDWVFPIDRAEVKVVLPEQVAAESIKTEFYTGSYGAKAQAAKSGSLRGGAWFETSKGLPPKNGFTIVMSFPKGIITEPTQLQKYQRMLRDNAAILAAFLGLLSLLAWFLWIWNKVGRDPRPGTIIPRFKAPPGLSPAAVHYVQNMGFDDKAMSAAIISLAIKGHVRINNPEKKEYSLEKVERGDAGARFRALSRGEQALLDALFVDGAGSIELDQKQHKVLGQAKHALAIALKQEYHNKLFKTNSLHLLPGVGIVVLTVIAMVVLGPPPAVVMIPFILISLLTIILFAYLLCAPTYSGRKVLDEIEGLKMYLKTAESARLNRMKSPELTPEVFETFLPYAFAMGVHNDWSDNFKNKLAQALTESSGQTNIYKPTWYNGYQVSNLGQLGFLANMGDTLGSQLSTAVAHSSSPPGSSSGAGGGGFSGGGGGGGGGGGW
ncbi:MAG: DUF2207 domain-containing protein [Xanthomonadales bacterium]|nr:DUF2207 domain-containing protein [Xanthomonadales bacterium]